MKGTQLAQSRPSDTNAVSVYSPDRGEVVNIKEIIVCNTTGSAATYRIFHDEDGTTYDQSTALFYDVSLDGNTSTILELDEWMRDSSGNLAVAVGTGSAITFTVSGEIMQQ